MKILNKRLTTIIVNYNKKKNDNANRHQKIINLENEKKMSKYL